MTSKGGVVAGFNSWVGWISGSQKGAWVMTNSGTRNLDDIEMAILEDLP